MFWWIVIHFVTLAYAPVLWIVVVIANIVWVFEKSRNKTMQQNIKKGVEAALKAREDSV